MTALGDTFVQQILACPSCLAGALSQRRARRIGEFLFCSRCHAVFPVRGQTPNLIDIRLFSELPVELLAAWHLTQESSRPLYAANDPSSCSDPARDDVQEFARFMSLAGKAVLDIGSGSFVTPVYATAGNSDHNSRIAHYVGIDPIPPNADPPFSLIVALAERLPFKNGVFDAVLIATSLDHVFDVATTLSEIRRVLRREGECYFWGMFVHNEESLGPMGAPVLARLPHEAGSIAGARHNSGVRSTIRGIRSIRMRADPVGGHLSARATYDRLIDQISMDREKYESLLVDQFHFRHFDRSRLMSAFTGAGFFPKSECTYHTDAGADHCFVRFLMDSSPQSVSQ